MHNNTMNGALNPLGFLAQLPFFGSNRQPEPDAPASTSAPASAFGPDGAPLRPRKIRVHKVRSSGPSSSGSSEADERRDRAMDRRIAELIPGIADLSVSGAQLGSALDTARELRLRKQVRESQMKADTAELQGIYDMAKPHPVDALPADYDPSTWTQRLRPAPRSIKLSHYQQEMINYQRMLLRKNIWYYRDRMSVPRGPCPLHVLKDAWVQGVIDENTLVWGQGLYDWLPAKNVKLLLPMIRTPEGERGLGKGRCTPDARRACSCDVCFARASVASAGGLLCCRLSRPCAIIASMPCYAACHG